AKTVAEVPVEKLMAKGELPDVTEGNKSAKVTIVEYSSMTCPHCATFHSGVYPQLKAKYVDTGKVYFVMREFPLDNLAAAVSMLARCAGGDKIPAMVSLLFQTQPQWRTRNPVPELQRITKQAGFTQATFEKCLDNPDMLAKLARQRDKASSEFGVDATPSFFINGKRYRGAPTLDGLSAAIDPLLKG
ncbi:MAG: DsbA family protein, partial [Hyphomicrobiaceae bacterium]|nr:DsbA family protein [Hyphomicrobiaceae bacterium]